MKSNNRLASLCWAILALLFLSTNYASAQERFKFSGLLYADYSYTVASPEKTEEGENGFGYRRVYFTADYTHSDRFSSRFRLEANDKSTTVDGKPAPFVKDLYVKWRGALGEGHDLIMGVSGPPVFEVAEKVWGYRSLEKTLMDKASTVSSRDMGIALKGRLNGEGSVRYGVMFANNESISRETDKHKRVYGQLEFYPSENISLTLGGDYASYEDGSAVNLNAFAGYGSEKVRFGVEAFSNPRSFDGVDDKWKRAGATAFLVANASTNVSAILRADRIEETFLNDKMTSTTLIAGVGIRPESGVEFIPNVIIDKDNASDTALVTGRITLFVTFK